MRIWRVPRPGASMENMILYDSVVDEKVRRRYQPLKFDGAGWRAAKSKCELGGAVGLDGRLKVV